MLRSIASTARSRCFPHLRQHTVAAVASRLCCAENLRTVRNVNSKSVETTFVVEDGLIKKFLKTVGWIDHSRTRLKLSGYFLYEGIWDSITYTDWFKELDIPDVFSSWFAITELHVWMLMVRCMAEDINMGKGSGSRKEGDGGRYVKEGEGRFIRNSIVEALWADVGNRIKVLEGVNQSLARKQVLELSEQFQAALISYDEGLSDDKVLAAALWRRIFQMGLVDAEHVERVVKLVRMQLSQLDETSWETLTKEPQLKWLKIKDITVS